MILLIKNLTAEWSKYAAYTITGHTLATNATRWTFCSQAGHLAVNHLQVANSNYFKNIAKTKINSFDRNRTLVADFVNRQS
jgi:hypothetical protein